MKLACFLSVALCLCLGAGLSTASKEIRLYPHDPHVRVGDSLRMKCRLRQSSGYNVSDVAFEFNLTGRRYPVHPRFTSTEGDSCLVLDFPSITEEYDNGKIICFIKQRPVLSDGQMMRVDYKPERPVITSYIVYNWDEFIFSWKTDRKDYVNDPPEYSAWFMTSQLPNFRSCRKCINAETDTDRCPHQNASSCTIPDSLDLVLPDGKMVIKVTGENVVGRSSSDNVSLDLYLLVKPAPVRNIHITPNGTHPLVLNFSAPQSKSGWERNKVVVYDVSVACDGDHNVSYSRKSRKIDNVLTLSNLTLFTFCMVSVRCKPDYADDAHGYWSDPVFMSFRSEEGVPLAAPEICSSCFFSTAVAGHREIVLYFKNLNDTEARGNVCSYKACLTGSSQIMTEGRSKIGSCSLIANVDRNTCTGITSSSSVRVSLSLGQEYLLGVVAATGAGFNKDLRNITGITIPKHMLVPSAPSNITVIVQKDYLVQVYWNRVPEATSFVIAWCKNSKRDYTCQDFQWHTLDSSHSTYRIRDLSRKVFDDMLFGVAVEMGNVTSGLKWSECTYDVTAALEHPSVSQTGFTDTTVTLSITKPDCFRSKAYVYGFAVYYWKREQPGTDSGVEMLAVNQNDLEKYEFTIKNLQPSSDYMVAVESLSVGNVPYRNSTPISVRTDVGKLGSGSIAGIVIGGLIGCILIVIGLISIIRWNRRKISEWSKVEIVVPSTQPLSIVEDISVSFGYGREDYDDDDDCEDSCGDDNNDASERQVFVHPSKKTVSDSSISSQYLSSKVTEKTSRHASESSVEEVGGGLTAEDYDPYTRCTFNEETPSHSPVPICCLTVEESDTHRGAASGSGSSVDEVGGGLEAEDYDPYNRCTFNEETPWSSPSHDSPVQICCFTVEEADTHRGAASGSGSSVDEVSVVLGAEEYDSYTRCTFNKETPWLSPSHDSPVQICCLTVEEADTHRGAASCSGSSVEELSGGLGDEDYYPYNRCTFNEETPWSSPSHSPVPICCLTVEEADTHRAASCSGSSVEEVDIEFGVNDDDPYARCTLNGETSWSSSPPRSPRPIYWPTDDEVDTHTGRNERSEQDSGGESGPSSILFDHDSDEYLRVISTDVSLSICPPVHPQISYLPSTPYF